MTSLGALTAWMWAGIVAVVQPSLFTDKAAVPVGFSVLILLSVLATVGWGAYLGRRRRWGWLALSVPIGATALLFLYLVAFIEGSDPNAGAEAVAGVRVISVPTAILVATLLCQGGGVGELVQRRTDRKTAAT